MGVLSSVSAPAEPDGLLPGYTIHAFDSVDSTNRIARELAADGAPDRVIVWAREQRAGRGRQGRSWDSPPGNLYLSQIVRPSLPPSAYPLFGFAASLAIADLVRSFTGAGVPVSVKWPNDVLAGGGKVAGILVESATGPDAGWIVVGTGINLVHAPNLPDRKTAAIAALAGKDVPVEEALTRFVRYWDGWRRALEESGFGPLRSAWLSLAGPIGQPMAVHQGTARLEGRFQGIDEDGALLLLRDGRAERITFGEVSHPVRQEEA